jgi:hypothetical protein
MPASSYQQQKLRVCEVCSAYLGIHDNDRRLADHFGGKLHLGFIKIREKLSDLEVSMKNDLMHALSFVPFFHWWTCAGKWWCSVPFHIILYIIIQCFLFNTCHLCIVN